MTYGANVAETIAATRMETVVVESWTHSQMTISARAIVASRRQLIPPSQVSQSGTSGRRGSGLISALLCIAAS